MSGRALARAVQTAAPTAPQRAGVLQRKCACGTHTPGGGRCESCAKRPSPLQTKLTVGAIDDPHEREANRVADQVTSPGPPGVVDIRRFGNAFAPRPDAAPPGVDRALAAPGAPLDRTVRHDMERQFGHDFSSVRVHSDAASAQQLNARAFTIGNHIVFDTGQLAPGTREGRHLLAHELTHVLQQSGAAPAPRVQRDVYRDTTGVGGPGHPPPHQTPGQALVVELEDSIAGAVWKEIRKRVYPKESAAGVQRAKDRHAGTAPDLTGLGKLTSLEHFASAMRTLQSNWTGLKTSKARVTELGKIANTELTNADVPGFEDVVPEKMEFKGVFIPATWEYHVSKELIAKDTLSPADAADLANTTRHESRHAEQDFLAARFNAATPGKDATAIQQENEIPKKIAQQAVAKKFDASTAPAVADLGKKMFDAGVAQHPRDTNQKISDNVVRGWKEMAQKRKAAKKALGKLKRDENAGTMSAAKTARDELKASVAEVERRYTLYRNIPYEADAHEVGDAEEQAFLGWP